MFHERCRHAVSEYERNQGESLARERRVILDSIGAERAEAAVVDGQQVYEVTLDWSHTAGNRLLTASCSCARGGQGLGCRHLWATLLELDRECPRLEVRGDGTLLVSIPRRNPPPPSYPYLPLFDLEGFFPLPPPIRPPAPVIPSWRQRLAPLEQKLLGAARVGRPRRREAFYRLTLEESQQQNLLVLRLYEHTEKANGEWGKVKAARLGAGDPETYTDDADRELLERLYEILLLIDARVEHRGYLPTNDPIYLPPAVAGELFPKLCATGRFGWARTAVGLYGGAHPLAWDGDSPWQLRLRIEPEPERRGATLVGVLARGEQRRPFHDVLLTLDGGWLIFPEQLGRVRPEIPMALRTLLAKDRPLRVDESEIPELRDELLKLPDLPPLEIPEPWRLEETRLAPRPKIALRASTSPGRRGLLDARISFLYGDLEVGMHEPRRVVIDPAGARVYVRDESAESAALEPLPRLGFRFPEPPYREGDGEIRAKVADDALESLLAAGWLATTEGRRWRTSGEMQLRVSTGIDWFELAAEVHFEDLAVPLPVLLEAVRRGERELSFEDGSRARLPESWLGQLRQLTGLAFENDGRKPRFRPSQAVLLDAMLENAPNVDVDAAFTRLRERLHGFSQIEPAREPRGFRGELRPYQRDGLGWLRFLRELGFGGCLADDMGLGKTIQVLALLQSLRLGPAPADGRRPSLIVAPRSLIFNWLDEAARFTPRLRVADYSGPARGDVLLHLDEHDVILTTYGVLRRDAAKLRHLELDLVVLDEAQAIKNDASQVAKASRLLVARQRLALTGTPVENHLGELWSIFEFLNPGMLGRLKGFSEFAYGQGGAEIGATTHDGTAALDLIGRALRPFILRRTKQQVLRELPEKTEQTLHCELEGKERKFYDQLRDAFRLQLSQQIETMGFGRAKIHVLEALLRLRQASSHWGLVDKNRTQETSAKLETLLEQLEEVLGEGHKALVFSQFVSLLAIVRQRVETRGWTYEYLDGQVRDRKQRVERFQNDPKCQLFLISLKAGGQGLNLTAADYVFILDPWWNPAVEMQAVDRAHRIGQTKPVFVYRLIARQTVEEKIVELQRSKRQLADAILTADKSLIRELTAEDLRLLLS